MKKKALPHDEEDIIRVCIEGLIKGYSKDELVDEVHKDYKYTYIPEEEIETLIRRAVNAIKETTLVDLDKIIPIHIERYEWVYKEFDKLRFVAGKIKAMKGKEKLVGMHRENTQVEIHNEVNIEIEGESLYDTSKLNADERKRLEGYMKKIER